MTKIVPASAKSKASTSNLFLRYAGSDKPAAQVATMAVGRGDLPLALHAGQAIGIDQGPDYTLLDPVLAVASAVEPTSVSPPTPGLSYSGFSPYQRAAFQGWLEHPASPAPPAFQQLLLANAEVRLLEGAAKADTAYVALRRLAEAPAWSGHVGLARVLLLATWLRQDGAALAQWSAPFSMPAALWSLVLGCQALLDHPLQPDQLRGLASAWDMPVPLISPAVLRLRLDSLETVVGQEPLANVLAMLGESARAPVPWRCQHRDLRLAFPQPNVRPLLQPLLADLLAVVDVAEEVEETHPEAVAGTEGAPPAGAPAPKRGARSNKEQAAAPSGLDKAHIIVEFGASRSDVFAHVLRQVQRQPGFQQLMDENRHIIYRVPFRRSEMRRFWQLWDYIQGWASTRVYCDGRQLDKWQIYPYSQYLR